MTYSPVFLKPAKDHVAKSRHPWVYTGALDLGRTGDLDAGPVVLRNAAGAVVGTGTFNPRATIAVRLLSFVDEPLDAAFFATRFSAARRLRQAVIGPETDSHRWVNGEGDGIPGLVLDNFSGHVVAQVGSPGLAQLTDAWLPALIEVFSPRSVICRPDQGSANREHMAAPAGPLWGETPAQVTITENGLTFTVDLIAGQKTGFFFDQRENRALIRGLTSGKTVLDAYCYAGAFAKSALAGGATTVVAVDSSPAAVALAQTNLAQELLSSRAQVVRADVHEFLRSDDARYDMVILDPPALAKRRQHLTRASRAYKDVILGGLARTAPGGMLLACSCSAAVDQRLFDQIVFGAAADARREVSLVARRGAAPDHPVSVFHPQGAYLKANLFYVRD